MMQILPFCSEETLSKLEENILKMRPVSDAPSDCKASDIVEAILDGIGVGDYNNGVSCLFTVLKIFRKIYDVRFSITDLLYLSRSLIELDQVQQQLLSDHNYWPRNITFHASFSVRFSVGYISIKY